MKVIAVTGMPGSGKEEFVKLAVEEGISVVRMGDVVRSYVQAQGLALTNTNVGRIAHEEREKHGYGIWAERTIPKVSGDVVLIDGIRGESELEKFRKTFRENIMVVGVHTSPKTRYERIRDRNREDATLDWESFCQSDARELEWGIGNALALCDRMIVNEGSLEQYRQNIRDLLKASL